MKLFSDKLAEITDTAVHSVMSTLALLYTMHGITKNSGDFLQVRKSKGNKTVCSTEQLVDRGGVGGGGEEFYSWFPRVELSIKRYNITLTNDQQLFCPQLAF